MRWLAKAALLKSVSVLPRAESIDYVLARHVTRSLPVSEDRLRRKFRSAQKHLTAYCKHGAVGEPGNAVFYEFGGGWDLAVQLSYWCLGVDRQLVVDIRPNLRFELVDLTLARLHKLRPELASEADEALRDPGSEGVRSASDLEERFGIVYLAPRDARETGLDDRSVDFVSNTATLEHVPPADLVAILRECRRLLRPSGIISSRVDLRDHYSFSNPGVSEYNFLRYSERSWRRVNSRTHYQNRLRRPDYLRVFAEAGFEVLEERTVGPTPEELSNLRELGVHPELRARYSFAELGVRAMNIVARPTRSPHAAQEVGNLGR